MFDAIIFGRTVDGKEIKPDLMRQIPRADKSLGRTHHTHDFTFVHCFERVNIEVGSRLHFGHNNCVSLHGDEVNLVASHTPIALHNSPPVGNEGVDGNVFAPLSEVIVLCHNSNVLMLKYKISVFFFDSEKFFSILLIFASGVFRYFEKQSAALHSPDCMEEIEFVITELVYESPDSDWRVFKAQTRPERKSISVTGNLAALAPGTFVHALGRLNNETKYGLQLKVHKYTEIPVPDEDSLIDFLSSRLIEGIGPATARRIVEHFGSDTVNILDSDIERLAEIGGIGASRRRKIARSWEAARGHRKAVSFLQSLGLGDKMAVKVYNILGNNTISLIKDNPYCLAEKIDGIGFTTADSIAVRLGIAHDNPHRCRCAVLFLLHRFAEDGHVYAEKEDFITHAAKFAGVSRELINEACDRLAAEKQVVTEDSHLYLSLYYACECGSARRLCRLLNSPAPSGSDKAEAPPKAPEGMAYDELQQLAIDRAENEKVLVLTGGPGTGKTTTVKGIIAAYKARKMKVLLAAPTGRAAKRLSEATDMDARTIHRLLEYTMSEGFTRNKDNQLEGDALIVDECSMIDLVLFYQLLQAVPSHMRLILAGDVDQLPSVGAGNVLADLINSGVVPVVRLNRIFRQAMHSHIVTNAHAINAGHFPDISNGRDSDFFFMRVADETEIGPTICSLVRDRLSNTYSVEPEQIQVLSPMTRGGAGTQTLNSMLQEALNPSGAPVRKVGADFRTGDKVMQTRNNYEKNVFNGDIGVIVSDGGRKSALQVQFDGRRVEYSAEEADDLTLAYAVTVHKSQGSEFPIVILPVVMSHRIMLQRNLIYTGITRAKRICVLVGSVEALSYAIDNRPVARRNSALDNRLAKLHSEC